MPELCTDESASYCKTVTDFCGFAAPQEKSGANRRFAPGARNYKE